MKHEPFTVTQLIEFARDLEHITDPEIPAWLEDGAKRAVFLLADRMGVRPCYECRCAGSFPPRQLHDYMTCRACGGQGFFRVTS